MPPAPPLFADMVPWRGGPDAVGAVILAALLVLSTLAAFGVVLLVLAWRRRK